MFGMDVIERIGPARAWLATFVAGVVALAGGSVLAPRRVYDGFIWQYFWGPVYADAHNAQCAVNDGGSVSIPESCSAASDQGLIVAEPGYTLVSEVGYMIVGLFFLIGILLLLRRLHLGRNRNLFFGLVPFMLFGGALRVVEDANNWLADAAGTEQIIGYPLNTILISPLIYFTVFFLTLAALLVSVWLSRNGFVESYPPVLGAIGTVLFVVTFSGLVVISVLEESVGQYPAFLLVTVGLATGIAYGLYWLADRFAPEINSGTGYIGLVVLWAHAIDGVANVLASDWWEAFGLPFQYVPKHPANATIISVTETVVPASITSVIGTSWPFLLVKMVVALGIVWLFNDEFIDENPRYAIILLMGIAAVGLGPGTRDMLRATFGI
ncbi:putative membrane protein [Halapricum desulfuricans]|uniref:Putative membrane protein n=2 Tax=Halapricum desulfuricans TaxID=2841257 RepID=A0A897NAV8_9EURY|nr:putative membrane protein [Halapricum desulfuricans]